MPNVKVANPASSLLLVNGGTKMQKRRKTTTRRKSNPSSSRAKRVTVRVNGKRGTRTTARRRRNPSNLVGVGLLKEGAIAAAGSMLATFVASFIPFNVGGALGEAAKIALVGVGLGEVTNMLVKDKSIGKAVAIGGIAAGSSAFLTSQGWTPQALLAPRPVQVVVPKKGVSGFRDIASFPVGANDPYYGTTPNLRGMNDLASVRPGLFQ